MAGKGWKKKRATLSIEVAFFRELLSFYISNRKAIRKRYRRLTRVILDYNDPVNQRPDQFLRQPQFEALEIYIFLKEYLKLKPMYEIFADWYHREGLFAKRGEVQGLGEQTVLMQEMAFNKDAYEKAFERLESARQPYPNYIFALTMGVGKTLLMATCIFYEFCLANEFPDDPLYCHNALIFAPDKTVLQALREIESFDFAKVLPQAQANLLQTSLKIHFLEESGATLNVLNNSEYNLVVTNTQKILLKKKGRAVSFAESIFLDGTGDYAQDEVYKDVAHLYNMDGPEDELDLSINQRFLKLRNLPNLGVYVDEAHHAFGDSLRKDLLDPKKETSLRFTINALAQGIKAHGSRMVACYNYTGTPYVKNEILPEVVYSYGLKAAIDNGYLKRLNTHTFTTTRDREFLAAVIHDFLGKYGKRKVGGLLPKLAFFSPRIEDARDNLQPLLTEILAKQGIPESAILLNVGDPKLTSNEDIRAFNELDTPRSQKQFIILVNKGKEGWNCRSLCGVAMFREPKSRIFVLQASMRCLRAIGDQQETGHVYLTDGNAEILNEELQQNFHLTTEEVEAAGKESQVYHVRVLKHKNITLNRVRHLYQTKEKQITAPIDFGADGWDTDKYRLIHTEEAAGLQKGHSSTHVKTEDLSQLKVKRKWSEYTLIAEIARYLCASPLKIGRILRESKEGLPVLVDKVNEYNELLYDRIIPELFAAMYEVSPYKKEEEIEVSLVNDPPGGFYTVHGDPNKTQTPDSQLAPVQANAAKSFHLDTYCFDSGPEQDFFLNIIGQDEVAEVYFTGMLTHGQSEFLVNYIDPETHVVRSYYPDFLLKTKNGEWIVVEIKSSRLLDSDEVKAKREFAEKMLANSKIRYQMVPHTGASVWRPGMTYEGSALRNLNGQAGG